MAAFQYATFFQLEWAWRTSAATPVVWGAAIDVPERFAGATPVPMPAEKMLTPGAVTSGLSPLSPDRGPPELKLASLRNPGLVSVKLLRLTVAPSAARRAARLAVLSGTPKNGIVTVYASPGGSGLPVMGPSNGGNPPALLSITTAAAPAFWPKTARATRAQVPRRTTTTLPATPAAVYSAGLQPSEIVVALLFSTTTLSMVPLLKVAPFASMACSVVPVLKARFAPGNEGVGSLAATLIPPLPVPGEPVTYGLGPELPAEQTTMTPAFAAFVEATALGSSALPNGEPSDMLITSMPLATAHSMASTVTSVEPPQPKTRTAYRSAFGATPGPTNHECDEMVVALYGPV